MRLWAAFGGPPGGSKVALSLFQDGERFRFLGYQQDAAGPEPVPDAELLKRTTSGIDTIRPIEGVRSEPAARYERRARVRAALLAAADRLAGPLVPAALLAARERSAAVRRRALERACSDNASDDPAPRPSRFSTPRIAFEIRG